MDWNIIIAYVFGLLMVYLLARLLLVPLKLVGRLLFNGLVGGVLLTIVNLLGTTFDLYLPINPVTALVAGFLGIPGLVLLVALQQMILG